MDYIYKVTAKLSTGQTVVGVLRAFSDSSATAALRDWIRANEYTGEVVSVECSPAYINELAFVSVT